MEHSPSSKFVSWLPMYHDMGLIGGILQPLYGGFPCYLIPPTSFLQNPHLWLKDTIVIRGRNLYVQDIELKTEKAHPQSRNGCGAAFSLEIEAALRQHWGVIGERRANLLVLEQLPEMLSSTRS